MHNIIDAVELVECLDDLAEEILNQTFRNKAKSFRHFPQLPSFWEFHLDVQTQLVLERLFYLNCMLPAFEFLQTMLLHEDVCLFLESLQLRLIDLFNRIYFAVLF